MSSLVAYRKLIGRVSLDAVANPRAYRFRALLVALLGHAVIASLFLLSLGLLVEGYFYRTERMGILMLVTGALLPMLLIRTLWAELPEPEGESIAVADAPKLWETLERLRLKLHAPGIDEVLINEEYGIRIEHFPRWIFFGPARHVLVIGLPWLMSLSPKQATAGIAQEYARYGRLHGGFVAWLASTREFWPRYAEALPGFITDLPQRIVARYTRFLSAYTLPLATDMALKADNVAAQCVGPERVAQSIVRGKVINNWLHSHFWPTFMRAADEQATPERLPYQSLSSALRASDQSAALRRCYQEEMQRKRSVEDVEPALSDRLRGLAQKAELTGMPEQSAAEHLLGTHMAAVLHAMDAMWREREEPFWHQRHETVRAAREWLLGFGEPDTEKLGIEALSQYAQALLTVGDRNRALPLLRRAADHPEGTAETAWSVAQIMLEHNEADALPYLDLTMDRDALRAREAAELALQIAERHGRRDRIGHYRRCVEQLAA